MLLPRIPPLPVISISSFHIYNSAGHIGRYLGRNGHKRYIVVTRTKLYPKMKALLAAADNVFALILLAPKEEKLDRGFNVNNTFPTYVIQSQSGKSIDGV